MGFPRRAAILFALLTAAVGFGLWSASRPRARGQQASSSPYNAEARALEQADLTLIGQGRPGEAVGPLLKAVALNPNLPKARAALGELYIRAGLLTPAQGHLEAATALDPANAAYWNALGSCRIGQHRYAEAAAAFEKAVALQPAAVTPLLNLADVQAEMNRKAEAEANYRRALTQAPNNPDARLRFIRFLVDKRTDAAALTEATELLRPLEASQPNNPYIPFYRGRMALMRGDAAGAIPDLKRVVARRPDVDVAWYALSRAYRLTGNEAEAKKAAAQSAKIRQAREAMPILEARAHQNPNDAATQLKLARLNAQAGRYAKALNAYEFALHLDPKNDDARAELARLKAKLQTEGKMPDMTSFDALLAAAPNPNP